MTNNNSNYENMLRETLGKFSKGLREAFEDITALEVNTMIVSEIKGLKFDPEQAYKEIYYIPDPEEYEYIFFLIYQVKKSEKDIDVYRKKEREEEDERLKKNYQKLVKNAEECEMKYRQELQGAEDRLEINNPEKFKDYETKKGNFEPGEEEWEKFQKRLQANEIFADNLDYMSKMNSNTRKCYRQLRIKLENACQSVRRDDTDESQITKCIIDPQDREQEKLLNELLTDGRFLRQLRKLLELKFLLESPEFQQQNIEDIIYAQTIIQIDGDVINRFDQRLFKIEEEQRQFLLDVHQNAVASGEQNWRQLLQFIINMVQEITVYLKKN